MKRREFLRYTGWFVVSSLLPFGFSGWVAGALNETRLDASSKKRLIVLFQRGAVDGLSLVIPHHEPYYYDARPTIAIPDPGSPLGAFELSSTFGLHPALEAIRPLWKNKSLAFVHACGSPNPTRSHFEAQDYMESGTPGERNTKDGWVNRLLALLANSRIGIQGISIGSTLPRIMRGNFSVANIPSAYNPKKPLVTDDPAIAKKFQELYKTDKELEEAFRGGMKARAQLVKDLEEERIIADHGAPSPKGFEGNCERLAQVMAKDPSMQIAFLDVGGWDTHINQGSSQGQLATHLQEFGKGFNALVRGLGDTFKDTLIVVVSEFGRTVKENGHGGTDHGHGNVLWVAGGAVQGGKVYGQWPGLEKPALYESRDLAITTDFRQVIGYLLSKHFAIPSVGIQTIFPGAPYPSFATLNSFSGLL